jgi:hypothetical protein
VAPLFPGDDHWLSEIEGPAPPMVAETDDLIELGHDSVFSRLSPRRTRLTLAAVVGIIGAVLLANILVRTASEDVMSIAPPAAVVGLSFRSALMPTMASECARNACKSAAASGEDLASLRKFFGATYVIQGDRIRDRHGVLRGLSSSVRDGRGDDVQLRAIRSPSAPVHWTGMAGLDGITVVTRTTVQTSQGLWLVESRAVSPICDGVTGPLWGLAEIGADAAQLHL